MAPLTPFTLREYYQIGQDRVALVMTAERKPLQAWRANPETQRLERDYGFIMDILQGDSTPINGRAFQAFCASHGINPAIPDESIALSYRLATRSRPSRATVVPPALVMNF